MTDLPAPLLTGLVTGRFIAALIDGADSGAEPDVVPAAGKITLTPDVPYLPLAEAEGGAVTVIGGPVVVVLDAEGYLSTPHTDPAQPPMARGVRVLATDSPGAPVTGFTWKVDYSFAPINGRTPTIPSHAIAVPAGGQVDLTTAVKVPSSPGVGIPQVEDAARRAAESAAVAMGAAQEAATAAEAAVEASAGAVAGVADAAASASSSAAAAAAAAGSASTAASTSTLAKAAADAAKADAASAVGAATTAASAATAAANSAATATAAAARVDTTAGRRVYVKDTTGADQLVYSHTGIRNIAGFIASPWSLGAGGFLRLVREGNTVTLTWRALTASGTNTTITTNGVPAGFRPTTGQTFPVRLATGAWGGALNVDIGGQIFCSTEAQNTGNAMAAQWQTTDPWPTTLPGATA
ncbi:hypothetical protein [Galactobacter caseinivorans]|uniref:Minor tail protein n=1 Tax=Galactobacter caseinivorans TaxID=2676123 RepID=A0A496PMH9_9MICC|nr:hypothetical protein [Galactobacter caseinivorans]RKW71735.1 hypothetical protein DWQ67_02600 [Galactobacter caseinivorans]